MKPGVVDEDVDAAELEFGFLEDVAAGARVGHVHREYLDPGQAAQLFRDGLELAPAARHEHEVRAGSGKQARRGRTTAVGPARYDDGSVFENHCGSLQKTAGQKLKYPLIFFHHEVSQP